MMKTTKPLSAGIITIVALLLSCASVQERPQTDRDYEMFSSAIGVISFAPFYVLVTVIDGRSGVENQVAASNDALRYAIHTEYGIPLTGDGMNEIIRIARLSLDKRFTFHRDSSLAYLKPTYTPDILDTMRRRLSSLTDNQIMAGFRYPALADDSSTLHNRVYLKEDNYEIYRDAAAHVLLERCILCGRSKGEQLYIGRGPCW